MNPEQIQIHVEDRLIDITLQRSRKRRRSVALSIHKDGQIFLKTPHHASTAELQRFVMSKSAWILAKLRKFEFGQQKRQRPENTIRFMGLAYAMQIEKSPLLRTNGFCEWTGNQLHIHIPINFSPKKEKAIIQSILENWYRKMAGEVFDARAKLYAAQLGVRYQSIKLADPKTRWGSCDKQGRLMFSWRAVMVPLELIDYLIVHELCHILHFDHSKAYWQTVESILPDYKIRRKQLREVETKELVDGAGFEPAYACAG